VEPPLSQPVAPYPDVSAEFPGVTLKRHIPTPPQPTSLAEPDWVQLADDAAENANLEFTDFLPPPTEVININKEEVPPILLTSQLPHQPKIEPSAASLPPLEMQPPSQLSSHSPSRARRPPQHLAQDYLLTTVAKEHNQPPEHPYQTAVGTVVDLAIKNGYMMAQVCHCVMTHTANSLYCAQEIKPKKKQYSLKAGLKEFTNRGKDAVTKELTQFHTLKCFKPRDPPTLSRDKRRSALTSFMLLTEKQSGEIKVRACANGSTQHTHIAKEEAMAPTVTSEAIFIQGTIFAHENRDHMQHTWGISSGGQSRLCSNVPRRNPGKADGPSCSITISKIHHQQRKRKTYSICSIGKGSIRHDEKRSSILSETGC
jgi:hypothetical protein